MIDGPEGNMTGPGTTYSNKSERRAMIFELVATTSMVNKEIAEAVGCTRGAVRRAVLSWGERREDPPKPAKLMDRKILSSYK